MAAGHRRLRRSVDIEAGHLKGRDRDRRALIGDVVDPGKGRRRRPELGHVLVGHDHDVAATQFLRNAQARVGRMRKRRAGIDVRDRLRLRQVGDVEDEKTVMPVADIEPVAVAQRMMAARRHPIRPRIVLAARLPLAGNPPAPDLDRLCGIREVEDHHDIADVAFDRRRDVGVAAVEIEAMHAAADGRPFGDQLRLARPRNVVDRDTAADLAAAGFAELLMIDDHDVVRRRAPCANASPPACRCAPASSDCCGSATSTIVVPLVGRMCPTYRVVPSTQTWPPPGQSKCETSVVLDRDSKAHLHRRR